MKLNIKKTITFVLLITLFANVLFFINPEETKADDEPVTGADIAKEWAKQLGYLAVGELTIKAACIGYAKGVEGLGGLKSGAIDWAKEKGMDKLWEKAKDKWGEKWKEAVSAKIPVTDLSLEQKTEKEITKERVVIRQENCITFLRGVVLATYKKRLLDYMTDETVKWIQGGGDPKFITDPEKFYEDAFQAAIGDMILQTRLAPICYEPLKFKLQINLMQPVFSERVSCTLDKIVKNIGAFKNDFRKGSWIAYQESLKLQNNPAGISLLTQDELLRRQGKKSETAQYEATVGLGFLGDKRCNQWEKQPEPELEALGLVEPAGSKREGEAYYLESPDGFKYTGKTERPSESGWKCVRPETITPGRVAAETITKAIGSDFDFIINANDLSTYGAAIINALINRITKESAQGLSYITKSTEERKCEDFEENSWLRTLCEEQQGSAENYIDMAFERLNTQLVNTSTTLFLAKDDLEIASSTNTQLIDTLNELIGCQTIKVVTFDAQASDKLTEAQARTGTIDQKLNVEAVAFEQEIESLNQQLEEADEDDLVTLESDIGSLESRVNTFFNEASDLEGAVQLLLTDAEADRNLCEAYTP